MVNKTTAQKAVVAALSGMMALAPVSAAFAKLEDPQSKSTLGEKKVDTGDAWDRISGEDRYETMAELFKKQYQTSDGKYWKSSKVAILVSGSNWPDALAAASLSGYYSTSDGDTNLYAPIILTSGSKLSTEAEDAIKNLHVETLYIVGGTASVSTDVESYIKNALVSDTHRIDGTDRVETSVAIFNHMNLDKGSNASKDNKAYDIIICSGTNYADALAIGGLSAMNNVPIILTDADGEITVNALNSIDNYTSDGVALILGGYNSVDATVDSKLASIDWKTNRIGGANRYETNIGIVKDAYEKGSQKGGFGWGAKNWKLDNLGLVSDGVIAVSGKNGAWADALVGAPYAAQNKASIMLVDDNALTLEFLKNNLAKDYKDREHFTKILGGENSVSVNVEDTLNSFDGGERI